jgi:hypothetical protein
MVDETQKVDIQKARLALKVIEQQKRKTSDLARMPIWLNLIFSLVATWFIYFDLIGRMFKVDDILEPILFLTFFGGWGLWYLYLKTKGIKIQIFPNNKVTYLAAFIGLCFGVFSDEIQLFLYNVTYPLGFYGVPLLTVVLFIYAGHRFPLSQVVSNEAKHEES